MSTITPAITDNRQKFNAAIAEASAPAPYGSERWQRAFDRLKALRTHVKTLTPEEAGIAYNNHFGPEVAVWDDKTPAWAKVGESSRAVSVLPNGDPMTFWSSENLIGFDEVDAFIIRTDVYEVDTDTFDVGNVYLRVYIGRHDPIDLTSPAEARMVHAALGDSARRFEEILDPKPRVDPDDFYDDDFIKVPGLTEDQEWERGNEVFPSRYPGAFAMRIDGGCQDTPANLYHQIDIYKSDSARIELVKEADKPWRIDAVLKDGSRTVNEISTYADWLSEAVKRVSDLNIADGFTAEENLA